MGRLLILTFAALAFGTNTFTVVGLLTELAADQGVSIATAGQVQTAFVLTAAFAGPLLAVATRRIDRKHLLVGSLLLVTATAVASALAATFGGLLATRAAAGLAGAMVLPLSTTIAAVLAPPEKRGMAVALVLLGMTTALLAAAPACTAIGAAYGWRAAFLFAGALTAVAAGLAWVGLPRMAGTAGKPEPLTRATLARLGPLWVGTLASFTAAFSMTSYLSPIAGRLAGAEAGEVGLFQMCIGIGSFTGIALGGRAANRGAGFATLAGALAVVAVSIAAVGLAFGAPHPSALGGALLAGGLLVSATALFSLMPVVQTRLAEAAGAAAPLALALNGSANFLGQAGGAVLGGAMIALAGLPWAPLAGAAAAGVGAAVLLSASRPTRVVQPTLAA